MPQPFAWKKLTQSSGMCLSARSGQTITQSGAGYVCFGGMDGRKNESGNSIPNNELSILQLDEESYSWKSVELDPSCDAPEGRSMQSGTAIGDDTIFFFGGIASSSPFRCLDDGWILDTSCMEWKKVTFQSAKSNIRAKLQTRRSGTIELVIGSEASLMPTSYLDRFKRKLGARTISYGDITASKRERNSSLFSGKKSWRNITLGKLQSRGTGLLTDDTEAFHDDLVESVMKVIENNQSGNKTDGEDGMETIIPDPRYNHSATLVEGSIVLFGGYGGHQYARHAFNDVHVLNLDSYRWTLLNCHGTIPPPRCGHGAFAREGSLYICGGYNNEIQFSDLYVLDLQNKDWSDIDTSFGPARWNFGCQLVEAIPSWRVFVLGGSVDKSNSGRTVGDFDIDVGIFELGIDVLWKSLSVGPSRNVVEGSSSDDHDAVPPPRESCALLYDALMSRIVFFGGWNNTWLDDVWELNVSSIIGPPYAVTALDPTVGRVTGGEKLIVKGVGFNSGQGTCYVQFSNQNSNVEVTGTIIDDLTIHCATPLVMESLGPGECTVRVRIGSRDTTTTSASFEFFLNTVPAISICYGPGILSGGHSGDQTFFMIESRNSLKEKRTSGGDEFQISVIQRGIQLFDEDHNGCIRDLNNGSYEVIYFSLDLELSVSEDITIIVEYVDENEEKHLVRGSPVTVSVTKHSRLHSGEISGPLVMDFVANNLKYLENFFKTNEQGISTKINPNEVNTLMKVMASTNSLFEQEESFLLIQDQIEVYLCSLQNEGLAVENYVTSLSKTRESLAQMKQKCVSKKEAIAPLVRTESDSYRHKISSKETELRQFLSGLKNEAFCAHESGAEMSFDSIESCKQTISQFEKSIIELLHISHSFNYPHLLNEPKRLVENIKEEIDSFNELWEFETTRMMECEDYFSLSMYTVDMDSLEETIKEQSKILRTLKVERKSNAYLGVQNIVKKWSVFTPLAIDLRSPSMRRRHWDLLMKICGRVIKISSATLLRDLWNMELHLHNDLIEDLIDQSKQEAKIEKSLSAIRTFWNTCVFDFDGRPDGINLMKISDDNFEILEEHQVQIQNMLGSRFLACFEEEVVYWQSSLANISEVSNLFSEVQRSWSFLENLFIHSAEVKKELPEESERFVGIDSDVRQILETGLTLRLCNSFCNQDSISKVLDRVQSELSLCEKALSDFMDGKRRSFPRFYFVSTNDLLDILSNGNSPSKVMSHLSKIFQAISTYDLEYLHGDDQRPSAVGLVSSVGKESLRFPDPTQLNGKVEIYMGLCVEAFRDALKYYTEKALREILECGDEGRSNWVRNVDSAQCALVVNMIMWVRSVEQGISQLNAGDESALKNVGTKISEMLLDLIRLTQEDLDPSRRQIVMCMITLDAHNRDVTDKLITDEVQTIDDFQWQAQLKSYWDSQKNICLQRIADATFLYGYEYLGNGPRLVVTPLTDRIYVTATQALHLSMGCAPAGPAGTGKTETTKDLANAVAKACYVFNASPEMDYQTMGNIFKGLASSGVWGCFDEFNRLVPEVLSVCTIQFKAVCDAVRSRADRFILQGDEISLDRTCGVFITMNPGYLGRSELPEGLKALFRPITVMVPDFALIMENMFMAEGFLEARLLAKKFSTLYALAASLLSKAPQYDWGMRAIKSVLVVAGGFKRADPGLSEQAVLMRAVRDTNLAKIEGDDSKIFFGLLSDLFRGVEVPRARDVSFEAIIEDVLREMQLSPDEDGYLVMKISQLVEILSIRHCVFLIGPPGSFKSTMWKVLARANDIRGDKTTYIDLNPKAVSTNDLYGYVNMTTREWKDGILSRNMRSLGQIPDTLPKWIILDGDLDANWVESMNSVMDDSRLLTLPSNERIPLKKHMRMIFEIRDLAYATPATVTRAGVVVMVDNGVQWKCYKESWINALEENNNLKDTFRKMFSRYVPMILEYLHKHCRLQVPLVDICMVQCLCQMLSSLWANHKEKRAKNKDATGFNSDNMEYWFVFCCVWAFGSCLAEVDGVDYRKQFSVWLKQELKSVKFPSKGSVFDYYVNDSKFEEWADIVDILDYSSIQPMSTITVPTTETVSIGYFASMLIHSRHPCMFIGLAGCGKTALCQGLLRSLNPEKFRYTTINMNFYTDSALLQSILEAPLEKKAGRLYAPAGKLELIYFLDDLNMPAIDDYGTQSAIALLRQCQDYKHIYDVNKIVLKEIGNTQYLACMNHTAGSFNINPRLQRHFWTCATPFPEQAALQNIYTTYSKGHFERLSFSTKIQEVVPSIVKAALTLHSMVATAFKKTASNFHYEFNIRHLSGVFGGLLQSRPEEFQDPEKIVLLWIHESERVYGDRLVSVDDLRKYRSIVSDLAKKSFAKFNLSKFFQEKSPEPLLFAPFAKPDVFCYDRLNTIDALSSILNDALREYNESNPSMDLVLFGDALRHVAKISRVISTPSGHALLVGVGGSGRQSLSRLSAFASKCSTRTIMISGKYGISEFKADLQDMYARAGVKDEGILFLFTDSQIVNERFLVFINDLLASGEIPDLYTTEDKDVIRNGVRSACKAEGISDTPENLWNFFIARIKKNLHMSICFSPVGDAMRTRARKFPALVNCTVIDWFQPWPMDALKSVGEKFLEPLEILGETNSTLRMGVVQFLPFSFMSVGEQSDRFNEREKRFAYTTPKSFLELVKLYSSMVYKKLDSLVTKISSLSMGLQKLKLTQSQVAQLEIELKEKAVVVESKAKEADSFAEMVGKEKTIVNEEAAKANAVAASCEEIAKNVTIQQKSCEEDLSKAIPLVEKAEAALDVLQKKDFQELKSFAKPPSGVDKVCEAAMHLLANIESSVEVDKRGKPKDTSWKGSQKMMGNPEKFLEALRNFKSEIDHGNVPKQNVENARPVTVNEDFNTESMTKKSKAAAGLCEWVLNILMYYDVVSTVEPKKAALREATDTLKNANDKLQTAKKQVSELEAKLQKLVEEFDAAIREKEDVMEEADRCKNKLEMARRLIGALGANEVIWEQTLDQLQKDLDVLPGDVLVSCSFVSYLGIFTKQYRDHCIEAFVSFLVKNNVPISPNCDPMKILTSASELAGWAVQGLPSDTISCENGVIIQNSDRWCLIIDPQLQGVTWIRNKESGNHLQVSRMSHPKLVATFEAAIEFGKTVLIENMGESIDAVLSPIISRAFIKRGRNVMIRLGDKEIPYHPSFRLFMQTKLSNPHYPPEIQAECTVINFTVTELGLQEQLLSLVVQLERPDLAEQKRALITQQNEFKVKLAELEALLLDKLANAEGDVLDDVDLILSLEEAKSTSDSVKEKVLVAKETESKINETSERYRPCGSRGGLMFFLLMDLCRVHSFYKYSLETFVSVYVRAIKSVSLVKEVNTERREESDGGASETILTDNGSGIRNPGDHDVAKTVEVSIPELSGKELVTRVELLTNLITKEVFSYVRKGLLDKHKLIVSTLLVLRIHLSKGSISAVECDTLIRAPTFQQSPSIPENVKSFIADTQWKQLKYIECIPAFKGGAGGSLTQNIEQDAIGWKRWHSDVSSETADLPRSFKDLCYLHRLILLRILRPDRLVSALTNFVQDDLGRDFVSQTPFNMDRTYSESSNKTPLFFVLFPGVDPTYIVESYARKLGISESNGKFVNISMGQGQEQVAINSLIRCAETGGWIMLQNVHLMQSWLPSLEQTLESLDESAHVNFRCILTSEPPPMMFPLMNIIPESIIQRCVKIADESPQDIRSNLRRAWNKFSPIDVDEAPKPREYKTCLFALCFFHSVVVGRKRFGPQGWSRPYPFNEGDLTICASVLKNYLEKYDKVPWCDMRYIFGEIMYGGHITDQWDRRTNSAYLNFIFSPELLKGGNLCIGFKSPDSSKLDYSGYTKHIEEKMPVESPQMFGMHPNAEIGFLTNQGSSVFITISDIQGSADSAQTGGGSDVSQTVSSYLEKLPRNLDLIAIRTRVVDYTPYIIVSLQESEMMNDLLSTMRDSMIELLMGFSGSLSITEGMETLARDISNSKVNAKWEKKAYFSLKPLDAWFDDLLRRVDQLMEWTKSLILPKSVWLSGLFNPMSFLTAIMQVTARERDQPLDHMVNVCRWTNHPTGSNDGISAISNVDIRVPSSGVYCHGFFIEGAGWEAGKADDEGHLADPKLKELTPAMPIVNIYAVHTDEYSTENMYICPVFVTSTRGATYVFPANMRMEADDSIDTWILGGAALLLSSD